jgi:predicted nucleic acid-binding protein
VALDAAERRGGSRSPRFLLDTNVISELRRPKPHGGVVAWLERVAEEHLHISAVTLGELQAGVEITREHAPDKAAEIEAWLDQVARTRNVVPMDGATFREWARLMHHRSDELIEDAMIAATATVRNLIVVTRNVRDFAPLGVRTFNPFATKRPIR